jgi:hypothetical protein
LVCQIKACLAKNFAGSQPFACFEINTFAAPVPEKGMRLPKTKKQCVE